MCRSRSRDRLFMSPSERAEEVCESALSGPHTPTLDHDANDLRSVAGCRVRAGVPASQFGNVRVTKRYFSTLVLLGTAISASYTAFTQHKHSACRTSCIGDAGVSVSAVVG